MSSPPDPTAAARPQTLDELADAFERLFAAQRRLRGRDAMEVDGVSFAQFRLLRTLAREGPMPASRLAEAAAITPASATHTLDALERPQFVTRTRSLTDRRVVTVDLTEEGPPPLRCPTRQQPGCPLARLRRLLTQRDRNRDRDAAPVCGVPRRSLIHRHLGMTGPLVVDDPGIQPGRLAAAGARRIRVEHWANALDQGPAAARSMLGGAAAYDRLPYFFSDQYDVGMEYSGYARASDRAVLRGDPASREFIAFWLAGDPVLAGMNVNVWDVADPIQRLSATGSPSMTRRWPTPARPRAARTRRGQRPRHEPYGLLLLAGRRLLIADAVARAIPV
jgi:DNA-binding MarR family transcriptional regulator